MEKYAVILAGGIGTRFWPLSRERRPKHLLKLFDDTSLLQKTVKRVEKRFGKDKILVVTNRVQKLLVKEQLPDIPQENIIDEPFRKNTSASICLASMILRERVGEAVMAVMPADHFIKDDEHFNSTLERAMDFAENSDGLVTIGIKPERPETGFGYIQFDENESETPDGVFKVLNFAEKPTIGTAERFLAAGDFLWNSGIFVWKTSSIEREMEIHMPDHHYNFTELRNYVHTSEFQKELTKIYGKLKSISIDYGLMEESENVYLVKGEFDWYDVGDWECVYDMSEKNKDGNALKGNIYLEETNNSYINVQDKFAAVIGIDNCVIVDSGDALLVCNRDKVQSVKNVIDHLKLNDKQELI